MAIARLVLYPVLPGREETAERWHIEVSRPALRHVAGYESVHLLRDREDGRFGALFIFEEADALEAYKRSVTYANLAQQIRDLWLDPSRPIEERIYDLIGE
jgi:hypothetical protein